MLDSNTLIRLLGRAIEQEGGTLLAWASTPEHDRGRQIVAALTRAMFRARGRREEAPEGPCEDRVRRALRGQEVLVDPDAKETARDSVEHWLNVLWAAGCDDPSTTYETVVVPEVANALLGVDVPRSLDAAMASSAASRVILYIATRNRDKLHATLHKGNKLSRSIFSTVTHRSPDDIDGWLRAVGEGARIEAEDRAEAEAEEFRQRQAVEAEAASKADRAQSRVDAKLDKQVSTREYGIVTMRDLIDRSVVAGAHTLIPERDGKASTWWLRNAEGSGYTLGSKVEAEYAAETIGRVTGRLVVLPTLPPMPVVQQKLGKWDTAKAAVSFFPQGKGVGGRVVQITAVSPETLKAAMQYADIAAVTAEQKGIAVLERGVVVTTRYNGSKHYAVVLVLQP